MKFYRENREALLSNDNETIIKTIMALKPFGYDYKSLVKYYRAKQLHSGLSEKDNPKYRDEEILKAVKFYIADVGHLLLMEEKILELLPSTEGLEPEKIVSKSLLPHLSPEGKVALGITEESRFYIWHDFRIEREIKDGKEEFFYSTKRQ